MKSIIISAFPGTGKSLVTKHMGLDTIEDQDSGLMTRWEFHDSDSSAFSWIYDEQGNKTDQRNPDFPANYIDHIKSLMAEDGNIIFVSSHEEVREALVKAGFEFYIVRPAVYSTTKSIYLTNYKERGNDRKFISLIDTQWYKWLRGIDQFHADYPDQTTLIVLADAVYMNNVISWLAETKFPKTADKIMMSAHKIVTESIDVKMLPMAQREEN